MCKHKAVNINPSENRIYIDFINNLYEETYLKNSSSQLNSPGD